MDEDIVQAEALPPVVQEPPKRGLRWVFMGANGLRAGWGVLLFILLYVVFLFLRAGSCGRFFARLAI